MTNVGQLSKHKMLQPTTFVASDKKGLIYTESYNV